MKALFCGDISPTADNRQLFADADITALFSDTTALFQNADVSVINLECALTEHDVPIRKIGPPLDAPLATADTLARLGVTCCALSNNHIFDFGCRGAADTLEALENAGLSHTGFGNNDDESRREWVYTHDGQTLCVIAVCEHEYSYALPERMGAHAFDPFETPLLVRDAKARYDRVVVLYHGGKEQCQYPSPRLRKACFAMAKSGADLILCQHSHCIGCYEQAEGCHILYGQGNFHFVRENCTHPGWYESFAVTYDTADNTVTFTPIVRNEGIGVRLADEMERAELLNDFAERNRHLQDGTWLSHWHDFCESKRDFYTAVISEACTPGCPQESIEYFAHYLDCEAHTDVWRELFPTYNLTNERD